MQQHMNIIHPEMDPIERKIVFALLDEALAAGYTVSVSDGMETVLKKSLNKSAIFTSLFSTGNDLLTFFEGGQRVGWVLLIYGNGEDVVSDYADNEAMEHLLAGIEDVQNIVETIF